MRSDLGRREFLAAAAAGAVGMGRPMRAWPSGHEEADAGGQGLASVVGLRWEALHLEKGRHLFVDNFLVGSSQNLRWTLHHPRKRGTPLVLGGDAAVIYDEQRKRFRLWYGRRAQLEDRAKTLFYVESDDGINWQSPYKTNLQINGFGGSVTDGGPEDPDPARRYKIIYWEVSRPDVSYLKDGHTGIGVAFSPEGLHWTKHQPHPVLPDLWKYSPQGDPAKKGTIKWREYAADAVTSTWDSLRKIHVAYVKSWTWPPDEFGYQSLSGKGLGQRLHSVTVSPDFVNWSTPVRCFIPDADDFHSIEFYTFQARPRGNQMLIHGGILDETKSTGPGAHGVGYTVLSMTSDLFHQNRMKEPWLDRTPDDPKAADHAIAWVSDMVTVGDEEFIYYTGMSRGHKNFTDRSMNLARLRKDGFVSRDAGSERGRLVTPLLRFDADKMTINAKVQGDLRLRILDQNGKSRPGFGEGEVEGIKGDSTAHPFRSRANLSELKGQPVQLEFSVRDGELYGFELN